MMVLISGQLETSARGLDVQLDTAEVKKTFRRTLETQRKFRGNCVQDLRANS
jgi:hypothetical protein